MDGGSKSSNPAFVLKLSVALCARSQKRASFRQNPRSRQMSRQVCSMHSLDGASELALEVLWVIAYAAGVCGDDC